MAKLIAVGGIDTLGIAIEGSGDDPNVVTEQELAAALADVSSEMDTKDVATLVAAKTYTDEKGGGGTGVETDPIAMAKFNELFDADGTLKPEYLPAGVTTPTKLVPEQPTDPVEDTLYIFPNADGQYQTQFWDGTTWHVVGDFTSVTDLTDYLTKEQISDTFATIAYVAGNYAMTSVVDTKDAATLASAKSYSDSQLTASLGDYVTEPEFQQDVTNLADHRETDKGRWDDLDEFESEVIDSLLNAKGLKRDTANIVDISTATAGTPYTVTSELGGLLTVEITNTATSYGNIYINGALRYSTNGLIAGVPTTKYYPLKLGDTVYASSATSVTFTPYIVDGASPYRIMYNNFNTRISSLETAILDIKAGIANKVLDGVQIDIEADSQGAGYTVDSASGLGARVTGQGVNALLAATGVVYINGDTDHPIYDNRGVPLSIADAPELVADVEQGNVITSSGMGSLYLEYYTAG